MGAMTTWILALLLGLPPAHAAAPEQRALIDLVAGRYTLSVEGMLCNACARAITEELSGLEEVASAKADFERSELVVTVKNGRSLTAARLRKALKRAAKRVNLGKEFEVREVTYRL